MNKTTIIILTHNNLQYNKGCLESIRKCTKAGTYEIVVVDNNSNDGTCEWLLQQKDIKVILNDENVGFPKGCNIGIKAANQTNDILLLNNDVEVCHNWLTNLQTALYSHSSIGAVCAAQFYDFEGALDRNGEKINFRGDDIEAVHEFARHNNISDVSRWKYSNRLVGFCLLIRREVLEEVGCLDEQFSPGNFEDDDLSLRILSAGYSLLYCHDTYVHHYGCKSFDYIADQYWELIQTNQEKFEKKWGIKIEDRVAIGQEMLRVFEPEKDKNINVLHIGCGMGSTLLEVKNIHPKSNLFGIETNLDYGRIAQGFAQISLQSADKFPMEFSEEFFDYILIGNYLEICEQPEEFLRQIKKYLSKGGYVIGNVQNVMHYSVLKNLVNNKWNDVSDDILNRRNKNYFTAHDIQKLIEGSGYTNLMIFHWFSWTTEEDDKFIKNLCECVGAESDYLYKTYQYTIRFQYKGE